MWRNNFKVRRLMSSSHPFGAARLSRMGQLLIATVFAINMLGACSSDQRGAKDNDPTTTSAPQVGEGPAPLTPLEKSIVDAFSAAGLDGQQAELPGSASASMWASGKDGEVYVSAQATPLNDAPILEKRVIAGVPVNIVDLGGEVYVFACQAHHYFVRFEREGGQEKFLERFIPALGCTSR